jgi:hypothetical protein
MRITAVLLTAQLILSSVSDQDVVGTIVSRDLAVEGVVLAIDRENYQPTGVCDPPRSQAPLLSVRYRIAVNRTILGTAEEPVLVVRVMGYGERIAVRSRVIAWADRVCIDGGRLWGGVTPASDLVDSVVARSGESGFPAFGRAAGIAIVRLESYIPIDSLHFAYTCDSLGWAIPTDARVPSKIVFSRPTLSCLPDTGPGVMLIVPIPKGFASETLKAEGCTSAWKIVDGVVTGFGVPPAQLDRALARKGDSFTVRPVLLPR